MSRTFFVKFLSGCQLYVYEYIGSYRLASFNYGDIVEVNKIEHCGDGKHVNIQFADGGEAYSVERDLFCMA